MLSSPSCSGAVPSYARGRVRRMTAERGKHLQLGRDQVRVDEGRNVRDVLLAQLE